MEASPAVRRWIAQVALGTVRPARRRVLDALGGGETGKVGLGQDDHGKSLRALALQGGSQLRSSSEPEVLPDQPADCIPDLELTSQNEFPQDDGERLA